MSFSDRMTQALMATAEANTNITDDERQAEDPRWREEVKPERSEMDAENRALAREHRARAKS